MTVLIHVTLLLILLFNNISFAQCGELVSTQSQEEAEKKTSAEDKVYDGKEVDVKAKVKRQLDDPPQPGRDCQENLRLFASLRVVLHKSGKVTEVILIKGTGCSYDKEAIRAARNIKFKPAMKDGQQVSQYLTVEYEYSRH